MPNDSDAPSTTVFTDADLERIVQETPIEGLEYRKDVASTNDLALELGDQAGAPLPLLVLAESQTAGRGRRTNQWWSSAGALTFSLVVNAEQMHLPPELWPQVSLTAGLAVCEALEEKLPGQSGQLKWPNDVFVQGKKICGILVETPGLRQGQLVIGIGVNVNNSAVDAPSELKDSVIAMCDVAGEQFSLAEILVRVVGHLVDRLDWVGKRDEDLRRFWRNRCRLTNRRVHVETDGESLEGDCKGIDDDGALVVEYAGRIQKCLAGTVTLLAD